MVQFSTALLFVMVAAAFLMLAPDTCLAFQPITSSFKRVSHSTFIRATSNEDAPSNEGQELAGQFYEQLKKRAASASENQPQASDDSSQPVSPMPPRQQQKAPSEENFTMNTDALEPVRKFTGASPSLFSERTASSSNNNLEQEREREFNLVGNFERSLGIQVAILVASIVFVVSVGLTGGITDGSDRYFGGVDEIDDTSIEYVQTDDAAESTLRQSTQESTWL